MSDVCFSVCDRSISSGDIVAFVKFRSISNWCLCSHEHSTHLLHLFHTHLWVSALSWYRVQVAEKYLSLCWTFNFLGNVFSLNFIVVVELMDGEKSRIHVCETRTFTLINFYHININAALHRFYLKGTVAISQRNQLPIAALWYVTLVSHRETHYVDVHSHFEWQLEWNQTQAKCTAST